MEDQLDYELVDNLVDKLLDNYYSGDNEFEEQISVVYLDDFLSVLEYKTEIKNIRLKYTVDFDSYDNYIIKGALY